MNIKTRYHCEFKDCRCSCYIKRTNRLCYVCNHSKIWHSKKSKPPTDEYLSFCSERKMAHTPRYTSVSTVQIAVFIPEAQAEPISDNIDITQYCPSISLLPI